MDLAKALERYLRHHRAEGSSPKTLTYHRDTIALLDRFLATQGERVAIEEFHVDHLRAWVEEQRDRGLSQKTVATRVRSVKAFTRWLVAEEWLAKDPLARFRVPKVDDKPKAVLSVAEVETLLAACNRRRVTGSRDFAILLLLFSTGLRAQELLGLRLDDIDWDKGLVLVRRGKGGKFRVVPLGAKAEKALDKYLQHRLRRDQPQDHVFLNDEGEPLAYQGFKMIFCRLEERTGIHCNAHKWRHSAAVAYLRGGGRVETLKLLLGHATLDQSLHYGRLAGVDLAAAHAIADPARSLKTRV